MCMQEYDNFYAYFRGTNNYTNMHFIFNPNTLKWLLFIHKSILTNDHFKYSILKAQQHQSYNLKL